MLQKLTYNAKKEEGFTLVELLIVVAIIAILAAIAIPQFSAYRKRGYAATVNSDAKNAFTASQAYFVENPSITLTCDIADTDLITAGYRASAGVVCSGDMSVGGGAFTFEDSGGAWSVSDAVVDNMGTFTSRSVSE